MIRIAAISALAFAVAACGRDFNPPQPAETAPAEAAAVSVETISIDSIAERFVKLGLALGQYDKDYVDAYHGPAEWADAAKAATPTLAELKGEAEELAEALTVFERDGVEPREAMLAKQVRAALARIRMAEGEKFTFDEETRLLYDAVAPAYDIATFDAALTTIDTLIPGEGELAERVDAFKNSLAIPADKLQAVIDAAIVECRRRTEAHYDLPATEKFRLEFVTDKSWSGYNWYQGDFESLIQINTDLPIIIDRAVDLGCHEGYPGHHVWNMFVERDFVVKNGWVEYSIYPLFSPQSLIGEGSANYGIELAFPDEAKIAYERDVLFPLAGLDPAQAATLDALNDAQEDLKHARNHIAREYLDGRLDREAAIVMSMKYGLQSRARAEQSVDFIDQYRGYVINYNLGLDLVRAFVERKGAEGVDPWTSFEQLLTTPVSASGLTDPR